MKSKYLTLPFLLFTFLLFGQSRAKFSKEEVLADLKTLRESLEEAHYNLYAYTTEQEFHLKYAHIKEGIHKDSFNLLEATTILQQLVSEINNGHTEIGFPGQSYGEYAYAGGTLFPLEIAFEHNIPFIRKNWSENDSIKVGDKVLGINGMSMTEILSKIYPQISAERPYFKNAKIELYSFPRLYWQVFGRHDQFEVEIQSKGKNTIYSLKAVDLIDGYEMKRNEVLNATMKLWFKGQTAYLNPGNFSGDQPKFKQFIDSSFAETHSKKSENLIIDLRNNGGGDNAFSDYLVSYIANRPFQWHSSFTLKTSAFLKEQVRQNNDTTAIYWKQILDHKDGEVYDYHFDDYLPQPMVKRFKGKVYVLINRQSHSQSAVTAAQIQDYGFGTIVGEETGDYPSLFASQFQYQLPHTGITVNVSKGKIVRVNGSTQEEGVIPDIFIKDYLLDENDEILDGLLKHLGVK